MKVITAKFILIGLLLLGVSVAQCKDYLTLTNPEGKAIEAAIIDVHRDWVTIELKSTGKEMRTEITRFSKETQKLIQAWLEEKAIAEGLEFGISSKTFDTEKGSSQASSWKDTQAGYSIRVSNSADVAVKNLTMKYLIIVKRERMGRKKDKDHRLEEFRGEQRIPDVPARETVKVDTKPVKLREQSMNAGIILMGGGMQEAEDELEGILVEFYSDGKLIKKEAKPSSLAQNHTLKQINPKK